MIKWLLVLFITYLLCHAFFNSGYELGYRHGQIDGALTEILKCIDDIQNIIGQCVWEK